MSLSPAPSGVSAAPPHVHGEGAANASASALRRWIHTHDDRWSFIVAYVGLALVLSIWISLFWLVAVVAVHFTLEVVRHVRLHERWPAVVRASLWETKLDIALVLFALALAAYMEVILGLAGLGAAARAGAQGAARAAGWTRALRGVLLSLDDVAQVGRAAVAGRSGAGQEEGDASEGGAGGWTVGDHIAIWLGAVCVGLLLLAPLLTDHTAGTLAGTLLGELHPWPGGAGE